MASDSKKDSVRQRQTEANVLIEFRMVEPMSEEVLDANCDDILEAVEGGAADIALGAAIALNEHENCIKLRFDVLAKDDVEIYKKLAKVLRVIIRDTALKIEVSKSSIESQKDDDADEASTGELATA
jgi:hypothetical protein